jgi:hypothetical protein
MEMKNKIFIGSLFLSLFVSVGCVPYSYETVSSEVIGIRTDAEGKIYEKIVRYDKKLNFIALIGHDGFFRPGCINYSRYSAFTEDVEYPLNILEYFPQLRYSCIKEAVPIPGSDRWITCEYDILDINEVEITLTVFSAQKGKIFSHTFERVIRHPPRDTKVLFGYFIEYEDDLSTLSIHEVNGISQIDTLTGEVSKISMDSHN